MRDRIYTDDELKIILQKALTFQAGEGRIDGYSHEQVEQIGAELGLSRELIQRAADSLELPASSHPSVRKRGIRFIGAPVSQSRSMRVSRALSDSQVEELVDLFASSIGAQGKLQKIGKVWDWHPGPGSRAELARDYRLGIRQGPDFTEVTLTRTQRGLAGGLFGGIVGGITGGVGLGAGLPVALVTGSLAAGLLFPLGSLLFSWGLAFSIYNGLSSAWDQKDSEAMRRIELFLE